MKTELQELINRAPTQAVLNSILKTANELRGHSKALASISGGADSDVMLDMLARIDHEDKVQYVFFDTGLEYQATKDHLKYLEEKYGIQIKTQKAVKPIPVCCKEFGQPFLSKVVSRRIDVLQRHGFKFEDKPFEVLLDEYCEQIPEEIALRSPKQYCFENGKYYRGCSTSIRWWCNAFEKRDGSLGRYNIGYNKYLKEFMVANPPMFKISDKCCDYAKKKVAKAAAENTEADLSIYGVRKAEGGARSEAYKSCFTDRSDEGAPNEFRPIFWYVNEDKRAYEEEFDVTHSKCYTEYGLKRTGCAGCPFGKKFEDELSVIEQYEPKLYAAVNNIFGDSYEYTRKYREFAAKMKAAEAEI